MMILIKKNLKSNKGFTLAEVLISLALISIVVMGFIGLFVFSARTNSMSTNSMSATYIARDHVEMIYDLSRTMDFSTGIDTLVTEKGYTSLPTGGNLFGKAIEEKYITVKLEEVGNLTKVIVVVYKDNTLENIEAQIETILSWD